MHRNASDAASDPEQHLATEWALFQSVETGISNTHHWCWEATRPVVVVGRSCRIADHVFEEACRRDGVPVLRRFSGGGAVLLTGGCLNYCLALSIVSRPELLDVGTSFRVILSRLRASLGLSGLSIAGGADLALHGRKVSGNAQRRGRRALIHHGTLLYDFDSTLAARYLREPARRPPYRAARRHVEFLTNLPLSADEIRARLDAAWVAF